MAINWNCTKEETLLIGKIADRAIEMGLNREKLEVLMDVTAVHINDCKLDLHRFLETDDFNFAHDITGIRRHIDTRNGKLKGCFLPRFAK